MPHNSTSTNQDDVSSKVSPDEEEDGSSSSLFQDPDEVEGDDYVRVNKEGRRKEKELADATEKCATERRALDAMMAPRLYTVSPRIQRLYTASMYIQLLCTSSPSAQHLSTLSR